MLYGIGCGDGTESGGEEDECNNFECPPALNSEAVVEQVNIIKGTQYQDADGNELRKDMLVWVINSSNITFLGYTWTWKYKSSEEAIAKKIGNTWRYISINHVSAVREGSLPGCLEDELIIHEQNGNPIDNGAKVKMQLVFTVLVKVLCCEVCSEPKQTMTVSNEWICPQ